MATLAAFPFLDFVLLTSYNHVRYGVNAGTNTGLLQDFAVNSFRLCSAAVHTSASTRSKNTCPPILHGTTYSILRRTLPAFCLLALTGPLSTYKLGDLCD